MAGSAPAAERICVVGCGADAGLVTETGAAAGAFSSLFVPNALLHGLDGLHLAFDAR